MRKICKILLSLSFFYTTALGWAAAAEAYDFVTPFAQKLTQAEYETRLTSWAAATRGELETLSYLRSHFVVSVEGLQVFQQPGNYASVTIIPWRAEDAPAKSTEAMAPYTIILAPGFERGAISFTQEGNVVGTFSYTNAMAETAVLLRTKLETDRHPRVVNVVSTQDARSTPTTLASSKLAIERAAQKAKGPALVVAIHMNVSPEPDKLSGNVAILAPFPHIVSFVPGGYMKGELKGEATRLYTFLQQLFSEQLPQSIRLAQRLNAELLSQFPNHDILSTFHASQINAFEGHTRPVMGANGVQCRNLAATSAHLPHGASACVYGFGPVYNHPEVWRRCTTRHADGPYEISMMLAEAYDRAIRAFLDGPVPE